MNRVEAFIWLLIRDHVPVGTISEILKELGSKTSFTPDNAQLANLVRDYADRLLYP